MGDESKAREAMRRERGSMLLKGRGAAANQAVSSNQQQVNNSKSAIRDRLESAETSSRRFAPILQAPQYDAS